jgi:hypothetical protein
MLKSTTYMKSVDGALGSRLFKNPSGALGVKLNIDLLMKNRSPAHTLDAINTSTLLSFCSNFR